jgi:transposase InsO family protein
VGGGGALKGISAESCIEAFMSNWVARFGVPETVTSDRGSQFSSFAWSSFCVKLCVQHAMTTAYHPQANGIVERVHRQPKDSLRACGAGTYWPLYLPWILQGLRAAPNKISGFSSTEAVFGQPLVLLGELNPGPVAHPLAFYSVSASPTTGPQVFTPGDRRPEGVGQRGQA